VLAGRLTPGQTIEYRPKAGRTVYLVPATGSISVNGVPAAERDGVLIEGEARVEIEAKTAAELVIVEVA